MSPEDKIEAIKSELAHAMMNDHHLSKECQGVPPGQLIPAVRIDYIQNILDA